MFDFMEIISKQAMFKEPQVPTTKLQRNQLQLPLLPQILFLQGRKNIQKELNDILRVLNSYFTIKMLKQTNKRINYHIICL